MNPLGYAMSALLLIGVAYLVFRIFVRRDYQRRGRLTPFTALLELLMWALYMAFPLLYNPLEWLEIWSPDAPVSAPVRLIGLACTAAGMGIAFGTMLWFGLRRAFGLEASRLVETGPYRFSRNPQLVGGAFMVIGAAVLWPSWYALGWVLIYGAISQMMVRTEEEHLRKVFGEDYAAFCDRVPRYLGPAQGDRCPGARVVQPGRHREEQEQR